MIPVLLLISFSVVLFKRTLKQNKYSLFCYILPYIMFVWKAVSLTYLESGIYSPELATNTEKIYSDYIFLLQMMIFWIATDGFVNLLNNGIKIRNTQKGILFIPQSYTWIRLIHCVVICYLYINLVLSGTSFSAGYDRFEYFEVSRLPFVSMFSGTLSYFFLFIDGVIFFFGKRYRKFSLILFALAILYQIAIGNRFSGLYQYALFFFAPYFLLRAGKKGKLKVRDIFTPKVILVGCAGIALLLVLLYISYREEISQGARFAQLLSDRIFNMQAGTMWGITDFVKASKHKLWGDPEQLYMEIEGVVNGYGELDTRVGLGKVMTLVSPSYVVSSYLSAGIRFSGWYLAVTYLSLGYIGSALFSIFLAFIFALTCVGLVTAARQKNVIMIALALYGYYQVYEYYRIGNFTILFNAINVLLALVIFIYVWTERQSKHVVLRVRGKNRFH